MLEFGHVNRRDGVSWIMGEILDQVALALNHRVARNRASGAYYHNGYRGGVRGVLAEWQKELGFQSHWEIKDRIDEKKAQYLSSDGYLSVWVSEYGNGEEGKVLLSVREDGLRGQYDPNDAPLIVFKIDPDGNFRINTLRFRRTANYPNGRGIDRFLAVLTQPDLREAIERYMPSTEEERHWAPLEDAEYLREKLSSVTVSTAH